MPNMGLLLKMSKSVGPRALVLQNNACTAESLTISFSQPGDTRSLDVDMAMECHLDTFWICNLNIPLLGWFFRLKMKAVSFTDKKKVSLRLFKAFHCPFLRPHSGAFCCLVWTRKYMIGGFNDSNHFNHAWDDTPNSQPFCRVVDSKTPRSSCVLVV